MKKFDIWRELRHDASAQEILDFCAGKAQSVITATGTPPTELWRQLTQKYFRKGGNYPFAVHREAHRLLYGNVPPETAPVAVAHAGNSNIQRLIKKSGMKDYADFQRYSVTRREEFWASMIDILRIAFSRRPDAIVAPESLATTTPVWLPGAEMNIAVSCFGGTSPAILYQRLDGTKESWSRRKLLGITKSVAAGLRRLGLQKGDAVAMYMPMTPECIGAYLGIIYAGCAAVSIADSLAAPEIERRIRISGAKAIITQDGVQRGEKFLPLYDKVCLAGAPQAIILACNDELSCMLREGDILWENFCVNDNCEPVLCAPTDAITILFSSGTTGDPKAIPWNHTTPIKCASDGYIHQDIHPADIVAWPTNIGWMMGPWLIFAALINRATIALTDAAPNTPEFCRFVEECRVSVLGLVPSLVKRWREAAATDGVDWSHVRLFSSTGEASNYDDYFWLMAQANYSPVIEYCGGTEIGGGYVTSTIMHPNIPAHFATPAAGVDFVTVDDDGNAAPNGEVFIIPPSIGLSTALLNRNHDETYFANTPILPAETMTASGVTLGESMQGNAPLRRHGDQIEQLASGYFRAHGRTDDTMNLGGIKISSVEIESVLNVDGVVETAAVAITPAGGGPELLVIFAVTSPDANHQSLHKAMQEAISRKLNPLFRIHEVVIVEFLPRTASNKVMRRTLRAEYGKGRVQ